MITGNTQDHSEPKFGANDVNNGGFQIKQTMSRSAPNLA